MKENRRKLIKNHNYMQDKQEPRNSKVYHKPVLYHYGFLRDLTLAPSPGIFESGGGLGFEWGGWYP